MLTKVILNNLKDTVLLTNLSGLNEVYIYAKEIKYC